jgi:hypothetical protein
LRTNRPAAENNSRLSLLKRSSIDQSTATRRNQFLLLFFRSSVGVRIVSARPFSPHFEHFSPNIRLMEDLTFDLVARTLPFVSDHSTIAYQSILTEAMCSFCLELLSLPTLPIEEHPHYHLATNLLESIHRSANHRTAFIIKSYLNTIKHLQFQYMNQEQLQTLLDLIIQLRQVCSL